MSAPITPIEITNKALVLIGALPITTFEETSAEAVIANQIYENVVEDCIAEHDWSFATGQKQLNRLSASPLTQYDAAYQVPTNPKPASFMRLWINGAIEPFEVSEDRVLCNATAGDTVVLEYQFRAVESRWEPAFSWWVIYRLAAEFAASITRKAELIQLWEQKATAQLDQARARNDKGRSTPHTGHGPLDQALGLIGALPTTRLSQSAVEKVIAQGLYTNMKRNCLSEHDWSFAVTQAVLSADDSYDSHTHYPDAYTAPTDLLAPKRLWIDGNLAGYDKQAGRILCDTGYHDTTPNNATPPEVVLEYVRDTPEADWSGPFWWFVTYKLAAEMILSIGGDPRGAEAFDQKAERQLGKARRENNQGRTPPRLKLRTTRFTSTR